MTVYRMLAALVLLPVHACGQAAAEMHLAQESWQGLVISFDVRGDYSASLFGLAELQSPRVFRNSEFLAGLRVSHSLSRAFRIGIECLQDRSYLGNSSVFLEDRCAVDVLRRWKIAAGTSLWLQPKLELRSLDGAFDQRLKLHGELLHDVHRSHVTLRAFLEPAIDHQFRGFEKVTVHAGIIWPAEKRIKVEVFDSTIVAKRPEYNINAAGMIVFIRLHKNERDTGEITR